MGAVIHQDPDESLKQSVSGEQSEPTTPLSGGSDDKKGAITYVIHRGPLRSLLLVLLLHFKPSFLN